MGITLPSIFGLDFNKLFDYNDIAGQNAAIATVQKVFGTIQGKASMLQDLEKGSPNWDVIFGIRSRSPSRFPLFTPL